jgi:hypothetical protein
MTTANLLPEARRERRRNRRVGRRWMLVVAAWGATLTAAHWMLGPRTAADAAAPDRQYETLVAETSRLDAEATKLRRSIDAARSTVDHPDWSVLLARIVGLRDESMVFRRWRLATESGGAIRLRIEGDTRAIGAPSAFAVRLESLGVFARVTLGSAERSEDEGGTLVRFAIDAELVREEPAR